MKQQHDLRQFRRQVGANIQRHRIARRMTLARLARRSGVSVGLLDHYELGKNQMGLAELYRIADALGLDVVALMG